MGQQLARTPSGLFPSGPPSAPRPTYREPHPVRANGVLAGVGVTAAWLLAFGLLDGGLGGYVWWTMGAGGVAWLAALVLGRMGDRGVAVGIAMTTAAGWGIAGTAVAVRWAGSANWQLW